MEQALGRLICDDAFRDEFYARPEGALQKLGFQLSRVELTSLRNVDRDLVELLARRLDDRVRRATSTMP